MSKEMGMEMENVSTAHSKRMELAISPTSVDGAAELKVPP